jgi:predicted ABC-type ATPase
VINFEDYYNTVISRIKDSGYNVVLCVVYNNYTNAKNRIEQRTTTTGRAVNEDYAKKSYRDLTFRLDWKELSKHKTIFKIV